jgi:hypothetical protein
MIRTVYLGVLLIAGLVLTDASAQHTRVEEEPVQDSIPAPRPRRETFIIETYPSPAMRGQKINIAYYNHNPEETKLRIVDFADKTIEELQPRQFMPNGLHRFTPKKKLPSGVYFVRLTTYTTTGEEKEVLDSRFIVVH